MLYTYITSIYHPGSPLNPTGLPTTIYFGIEALEDMPMIASLCSTPVHKKRILSKIEREMLASFFSPILWKKLALYETGEQMAAFLSKYPRQSAIDMGYPETTMLAFFPDQT